MEFYRWAQDWTWGLSLIGLSLLIHATAVVLMAIGGVRVRDWLETCRLRLRILAPAVICVIGTVGLLLAALHGGEAAIWAAAYVRLGALDTFSDAMFYSVDAMTTRGASGLMLQPQWRMMGALEATDGMLLFGISTAYMFAVLQAYWPMLRTHRH